MITGLLKDLLSKHFSDPLRIEEPDLRNLVWQEGVRTGMLIESIGRWRDDLVEKRPALIIKPNGRKNIRVGIADRAGATIEGFELFQTFWAGSHTVFSLATSLAACEILATEAQRQLTQFHSRMIGYLNLYAWQVVEVGAPFEVEEATETIAMPINVSWVYDEHWQVAQESLKLGTVSLDTLLDGLVPPE